MKYFNFDKHEYWALVAAETVEVAYEVYAKEVGGEDGNPESVKEEGEAVEVTKELAFGKFLNAVAHLEENKGRTIKDFTNEFLDHENTTILITSELA
ncbi:hypothetical protein [Bacillus cereus group sp. Bc177]|uniref:hypothetical protein n=1 Tax=Bacillus cereus group sp. Bc177 TaxID=3018114 RepID=UPI0022E553FB|nr:hypothetical protein [Bacillus cereus group sp. Bc177]MDA2322045.1 hypothetical protein [Bacillus cereus group sp. Bc177]